MFKLLLVQGFIGSNPVTVAEIAIASFSNKFQKNYKYARRAGSIAIMF